MSLTDDERKLWELAMQGPIAVRHSHETVLDLLASLDATREEIAKERGRIEHYKACIAELEAGLSKSGRRGCAENLETENAALRESIIEGDAERKRLTGELGKLRMENEKRYETLVALVKRRGFIVTEEHGLEVRLVDDDLAARRNELARLRAELAARDKRIEELELACVNVLFHLEELRDAWTRGIIAERDGLGGTRSNRNVDVEVALRKVLCE